MGDKGVGLRAKYRVEKIVNEPYQQKKFVPVTNQVFVLNPESDPIAKVALQAYATEAANRGYEALAEDLFNWIAEI